MQTLVEIGPSNASQGQHRRKDATEQMKNLTHARTRFQVLGFSSANDFELYLMRCGVMLLLLIMYTHIYIYIYIYIYIKYIIQQFSLIYVFF